MFVFEIEKEKLLFNIVPGVYSIGEEIVDGITLCEENGIYEGKAEMTTNSNLKYFVYTLYDNYNSHNGCKEYKLPNKKFKNYWKKFIYPENEKYYLIDRIFRYYDNLQMYFENYSRLNKTLLLFGPSGCGKSTIARAVAQKVAIRLEKPIVMKEINCSEMFSKYYNETINIISRIFKDSELNTIFIIDDIESFAGKKKYFYKKDKPNDYLKILNAFLSIIDKYNFIFIFTTNFIEYLDTAFLDRCDYVVKIQKQNEEYGYRLFVDIMREMKLKNYLDFGELTPYDKLDDLLKKEHHTENEEYSLMLYKANKDSRQLSTRQIKKILFESIDFKMQSMEDFLFRLIDNIEKRVIQFQKC